MRRDASFDQRALQTAIEKATGKTIALPHP